MMSLNKFESIGVLDFSAMEHAIDVRSDGI